MFIPKTPKIQKIIDYLKEGNILYEENLNNSFNGKLGIYIDYSNIAHWSDKLLWEFDIKRMKQFFDSFDNTAIIDLYHGTDPRNPGSIQFTNQLKALGYKHTTKDVKYISLSIDVSSIDKKSTVLLKNFIKQSLLKELPPQAVISLNTELGKINMKGKKKLLEKKCNFDIEMSHDMMNDSRDNCVDCFMVWTADTDFFDPIKKLLEQGKKVVMVTVAGTPSFEFNELTKREDNPLHIFDVRKIKEFICKNTYLPVIE